MTAVLEARSLRTVFTTARGTAEAVRGLDLTVKAGQRLAIVGESGCGKSALALSLLGLIEPPGRIVAGEVLLDGRRIDDLPEPELRRIRGREIALIYQDPMAALDPVRTIGYQLAEALLVHGTAGSRRIARRRAIELLADVEVPDPSRRVDAYPHEFSGGMRQRAVIAMALANDPKVVLADEPTTALDVTTQAQVLALLSRLVDERGAAVVLITHNLGVVAEFCDDVRVMYAGRIVESATATDLFERHRHPYAKALLEAIPRPGGRRHGRLPSIPGLPPDLARLPGGCTFRPRCPVGRERRDCATEDPPLAPGGDAASVACLHPLGPVR